MRPFGTTSRPGCSRATAATGAAPGERVSRRSARTLLACALALAAAGCGAGSASDAGPSSANDDFDSERAFADLEAQVALGPRPAGSPANRRQARLLARRLRSAGVEDVRIQRPHRNVVGVLRGREPGFVVVGAHHDTKDVPGLLGANDGASGVAVVPRYVNTPPVVELLPGCFTNCIGGPLR